MYICQLSLLQLVIYWPVYSFFKERLPEVICCCNVDVVLVHVYTGFDWN